MRVAKPHCQTGRPLVLTSACGKPGFRSCVVTSTALPLRQGGQRSALLTPRISPPIQCGPVMRVKTPVSLMNIGAQDLGAMTREEIPLGDADGTSSQGRV